MTMGKSKIWMVAAVALPLMMTGCKTAKNITDANTGATPAAKTGGTSGTGNAVKKTDNVQQLSKVMANVSTAKAMVANIDFNLKSGKKDLTVDGKLSMKKDQVIRIQLTPLGLMEVGRIELTPDSVLFIDRVHKQYMKSSYQQVSFLKNNGIDFYTLQALFWNQLFVPGERKLGDAQLNMYDVDNNTIKLEKGKMEYLWTTDTNVQQLISALATYTGNSSGQSMMKWGYSDFKSFSGKKFPALQNITISTNSTGTQKTFDVTIKLKSMKEDSSWDTETKVSGKYKPVQLKDVINQIMNIK